MVGWKKQELLENDTTEEMLLVGLRNGLIALGIGGLFLLLQYLLQ